MEENPFFLKRGEEKIQKRKYCKKSIFSLFPYTFIREENKITFLLICPLRHIEWGGGGAKGLCGHIRQEFNFLWTAPLIWNQNPIIN